MVKDKQPKLVFLMETMVSVGMLESLKRKLQMDGCFVVDPMHRRGGLALFWKSENEVEVLNYFQWHINMLIKGKGNKREWFFIGFYGHPDTGKNKY